MNTRTRVIASTVAASAAVALGTIGVGQASASIPDGQYTLTSTAGAHAPARVSHGRLHYLGQNLPMHMTRVGATVEVAGNAIEYRLAKHGRGYVGPSLILGIPTGVVISLTPR
ncbi:hypothetical protein [Gordonia sp. 852002-10350_SCH5691597]|uniref:hypothetical protein n=1 Tax=Gordonia sp. 852002-10350_SCH5691597 TaxID=1834085 RepID=UPI0007EB2E0A|nr:hypothetical protein [Gordonia sp. 852002-10350_SCH5691597]OBA73121.1 hypothetical protein A5777_10535 [Gordonia sp. 852002-10350_SCH5691597]